MKSFLTSAAAATAIAVAGTAQAVDVKVGSVAGVTGPIAELVDAIIAGRNMAAVHVNSQGGMFGGGDKLSLVLSDSQCDPKAGVDAGNKVVNVEQVVAIVGASCSGATNGMVQSVTIPSGVVALSDSATAPSITELEDNDLVFRVAPSDAYQGLAIAKLAMEKGYKKVAMTYANDDYNAGIAAVFEQEFKAMGGEITANQVHEPNKASYRAEVTTLSNGNPEALAIFAYYGGSGITIIRNSLETGAFGKFMAADGMFDVSVIEQIGADNLRDNIVITQAASDDQAQAYRIFAEAFQQLGRDPAAPYAAHGYDAVFLIALAIEKAGVGDRSKVSAALRAVSNGSGEVILPGEWAKAKELIAAGKDINYEGASGLVDFDENGDVSGLFSANTVGDGDNWVKSLLR
ncbi:MAG: ABC transporter substrate-binding protein [Gammaproteobacteria bacterium]